MTAQSPTAAGPSFRRLLLNRYTLAAFVVGSALAAGVSAWAGMSGCNHAMTLGGTHSAADMSAHVDHVLKHFYVEIEATDAQKAQIDPIVKQAVSDLLPMHAELHTAHTHAMQALAQASVDRGGLEAARLEHLQVADQASKRFAQLIADVGDVLTVTQRKAFAEHLEHMHGMPHS